MFNSFFIAGFECATGYNRHGEWIDQVAATRHDVQMDEDYRLLAAVGIRAAREGIRWPLVEKKSHHDFSTVDLVVRAARRRGIEIIYDLFHFGYPQDVDFFAPQFPDRFADYCTAVARRIAAQSDGPHYFTPINEPSYFAWAAGDMGLFAPYFKGRGAELKVHLVAAAIRAVRAIRDVCPDARFINVDPLCRVVAPPNRPDLDAAADSFNNNVVFESWDMMAGRLHPELGGSPDVLDIVGINYYWTNQWALDRPETPLSEDDPRYSRLSNLVASVATRYPNELLVTETGHVDHLRSGWMESVAEEAETLLEQGAPLRGVCLYPILGMPEWHDRSLWTRMGLWDLVRMNGHLERVCHGPMLDSLQKAQLRLEKSLSNQLGR